MVVLSVVGFIRVHYRDSKSWGPSVCMSNAQEWVYSHNHAKVEDVRSVDTHGRDGVAARRVFLAYALGHRCRRRRRPGGVFELPVFCRVMLISQLSRNYCRYAVGCVYASKDVVDANRGFSERSPLCVSGSRLPESVEAQRRAWEGGLDRNCTESGKCAAEAVTCNDHSVLREFCELIFYGG